MIINNKLKSTFHLLRLKKTNKLLRGNLGLAEFGLSKKIFFKEGLQKDKVAFLGFISFFVLWRSLARKKSFTKEGWSVGSFEKAEEKRVGCEKKIRFTRDLAALRVSREYYAEGLGIFDRFEKNGRFLHFKKIFFASYKRARWRRLQRFRWRLFKKLLSRWVRRYRKIQKNKLFVSIFRSMFQKYTGLT